MAAWGRLPVRGSRKPPHTSGPGPSLVTKFTFQVLSQLRHL